MAVGRLLLIFGLALSTLAGCGERPQIRTYRTPRRDRMLAAVVERGDTAWFFRLNGQRERVDVHVAQFEKFIDSLAFDGAGQGGPTWTLPAGWNELPKTAEQNLNPAFPRYATIQVEATRRDPLEIAVTRLPAPVVDPLGFVGGGGNRWLALAAGGQELQARTQFLLGNVNRWLGQLRRSPIEAGELGAFLRPLPRALVFDATGFLKPSPPAAAAPPREPPSEGPPLTAPPDEAAPPFVLGKPPADWRPAQPGQFSVEAYAIQQGDLKAAYTVSPFPASGPIADRLQNVNRWRGELRLEPWRRPDLDTGTKVFGVDSRDGILVDLTGVNEQGRPTTTLGVMVEAENRVWFFKLMGDVDLVARQRENFTRLVSATKFSPTKE